jgi:hypothetical protein
MSIPDLEMHFRKLEVREQIAGEHGLRDPDETLPGRPLESDPRAENRHVFQQTKMRSCDVLVFWLRPETIPG